MSLGLASELNQTLRKFKIRVSDLHSGLSQTKRQYILEKFREGSINVIVATDVAARGIDVPEVNLIIQSNRK
jgi:superfamily II DNA/RNA helicase